MPQVRYSHSYHMVSPDADASARVTVNGIQHRLNLSRGVAVDFDAGAANGVSTVVTSNAPILISHRGTPDGSWFVDASPMPPAATELWGIRSTGAYIGAVENDTRVTIYASDGSSSSVTLDSGGSHRVSVGSAASQGAGSAIHVVADKPVSAIQIADGDGTEQTAFFPTALLNTRFGFPKAAQYVAVVCPSAETTVTLHNPGGSTPISRACNAGGNYPGKTYFGTTANGGAPIREGAYLESDKPVYVIYEVADSSDEHNLIGSGGSAGWQGYEDHGLLSDGNYGSKLTAPHAILDLSDDISDMELPWLEDSGGCATIRKATMEHIPAGGFFGNGTMRFTPGDFSTNCGSGGQHYAGIGQIHDFDVVGDSSRVTIGYLVRWGKGFIDGELSLPNAYNGKHLVLVKNNHDPQHVRPMMIARSGPTTAFGACNGTVCNYNNTPDNQDWWNENGNEPDVRKLAGKWVWVEFQVDTHGPDGEIHIKMWDEDGIYRGTTVSQKMTNGGGNGETYGGKIKYLDILGGYMVPMPTFAADPWYELERVEIVVGSDADLTPPAGFPGSRRSPNADELSFQPGISAIKDRWAGGLRLRPTRRPPRPPAVIPA